MRFLPALLLTALAARGADEFLPPAERDAFLKKTAAAMQAVKSFRASFVQEKKLKVFQDTVRSEGVIVFERPDRVRWELTKPFRSLLIVNGAEVGKFRWVDGKREALKLGRAEDAVRIAMERIRDWFRGEFDQKEYEIDVAAKPEARIVLRPRGKALRKTITALEFYPTKKLNAMQRVVIREAAGDVTTMRFADHKPGYQPPKGTFSTTDPAE
ncbi:MAG: outer membrane lipoprotein carrier protein LolA [Planctomycetota bacterium]|jgi:outer membrane lipoprotein-sorting protein